MRSQTAQNITALDGEFNSISYDILDLRENVTSLDENVGLEIMSLNESIIGLNQDFSVKLDNINSTQVSDSFSCS